MLSIELYVIVYKIRFAAKNETFDINIISMETFNPLYTRYRYVKRYAAAAYIISYCIVGQNIKT